MDGPPSKILGAGHRGLTSLIVGYSHIVWPNQIPVLPVSVRP